MAKKATTHLFEDKAEDTKALTDEKMSDDIIDINIKSIMRQRFRINGDNSKIVELDVRDMNIATRLEKAYNRLTELVTEISDNISENEDDDKAVETVDRLDKEMRAQVDYIFDYPVSDTILPTGSMWSLYNGVFQFEYIIGDLTKLYKNNIESEYHKLQSRFSDELEVKRKALSKYHK